MSGNLPLTLMLGGLMEQYRESKKRGCPTCDGIDPKSCMRCNGKTRMCDWYNTDMAYDHANLMDKWPVKKTADL